MISNEQLKNWLVNNDFPYHLKKSPQTNQSFTDLESGEDVSIDKNAGGILASTQDSGVALNPKKLYVLESPDEMDVRQVKGNDPNAYKLLQQGYKVQAGTLYDDMDEGIKKSVQGRESNMSAYEAFGVNFIDTAAQTIPSTYSSFFGDKSFVGKLKEAQEEHLGVSIAGGVSGALAPVVAGAAAGSLIPGVGTAAGAVVGGVASLGRLFKIGKVTKAGLKLLTATKTGKLIYKAGKPLTASALVGLPVAWQQTLIDGYDKQSNEVTVDPKTLATNTAITAFLPMGLKGGYKAISYTLKKSFQGVKKVGKFVGEHIEDALLGIKTPAQKKELAKAVRENVFFRKFLKDNKVDIDGKSDEEIVSFLGSTLKKMGVIGKGIDPIKALQNILGKTSGEIKTKVNQLFEKNIELTAKEIDDIITKSVDPKSVGGKIRDDVVFLKEGFSKFQRWLSHTASMRGVKQIKQIQQKMQKQIGGKLEDLKKIDPEAFSKIATFLGYKGIKNGIPQFKKVDHKTFQKGKELLNTFLNTTAQKNSSYRATLTDIRKQIKSLEKFVLNPRLKKTDPKYFQQVQKAKKLLKEIEKLEDIALKGDSRTKAVKDAYKKLKDLNKELDETHKFLKNPKFKTSSPLVKDAHKQLGELYSKESFLVKFRNEMKVFSREVNKAANGNFEATSFYRTAMEFYKKNQGKMDTEAKEFFHKFFAQIHEKVVKKISKIEGGKGTPIKELLSKHEFLETTLKQLKGAQLESKVDILPNIYFVMAAASRFVGTGLGTAGALILAPLDRVLNKIYNYSQHSFKAFEKNINAPKKTIKPRGKLIRKAFEQVKKDKTDEFVVGYSINKIWSQEDTAYQEYIGQLYDEVHGKTKEDIVASKTLYEASYEFGKTFGEDIEETINNAAILKAQQIKQELLEAAPKMYFNDRTQKFENPEPIELRKHARLTEIAYNPANIYKLIDEGTLLPEEADFIRRTMPSLYENMSKQLGEMLRENYTDYTKEQIDSLNLFLNDEVPFGTKLAGVMDKPHAPISDVDQFRGGGNAPYKTNRIIPKEVSAQNRRKPTGVSS